MTAAAERRTEDESGRAGADDEDTHDEPFRWALVGDDEPVALDDRPVVRELMRQTDPAVAVEMWARMVTEIAARLARLHPVLTAAADGDEEAAALNAVSERNRLGGARGFVEQLRAIDGLRHDLTVDRAAAMASLLMDPLGYRRLVLDDGWTTEEYADWVARLAAASFLPADAGSADETRLQSGTRDPLGSS